MKKRLLPLIIIASLISTAGVAQQAMLYNHYYLNPFLYNPSYIAPTGYTELYLNYRKQWVGISGAPTTSTLNLQVPLSYKSGIAFSAVQDEAGILKTTTGMVSFSYSVYLGRKITEINRISFGLSAGVTSSRIDPSKADDPLDPVVGNNTTSLDGQFGVHYRYNNFKIGFAIPRIFDTQVVSEQSFSKPGIAQLKTTISQISYDFRLSPRFSFEPMVTYRTYQNLDPHFEGMGTFKIDDIAWVGGAYRQNYGAFAYLGFNVKQKLKVAYAYEFATDQTDRIGNGTHEVQVVFRLGKKQHTRQQTVSQKAPPPTVQPEAEAQQQAEPQDQEPVKQEENIVTQPSAQPEKIVAVPDVQTQPSGETKTPDNQTAPATQTTPKEKQVKNLKGEGLAPGHYVVVGVFVNSQNAIEFMSTLRRSGYPANVAYDPVKQRYVVHMDKPSESIDDARKMRDKYRQMSRYSFRDTWVLTIE